MIDREKIIKAIEYCTDDALICHGDTCPYWQDAISNIVCWNNLMKDTLELLKTEKKTKVVFEQYDGWIESECGNCGQHLDKAYSRCPKCNKELDWNGG